mmetsp:Transcript_2542/g.9168  ORF Transcript_2542/g.9168 Transcript_2542/m.9168 type:complete len:261 (+) Transcript_2542:615-1397(+)|eukprot:scaffold5075_cov296-Prasinococcus_capsulatus_cf.AAC.8
MRPAPPPLLLLLAAIVRPRTLLARVVLRLVAQLRGRRLLHRLPRSHDTVPLAVERRAPLLHGDEWVDALLVHGVAVLVLGDRLCLAHRLPAHVGVQGAVRPRARACPRARVPHLALVGVRVGVVRAGLRGSESRVLRSQLAVVPASSFHVLVAPALAARRARRRVQQAVALRRRAERGREQRADVRVRAPRTGARVRLPDGRGLGGRRRDGRQHAVALLHAVVEEAARPDSHGGHRHAARHCHEGHSGADGASVVQASAA